MGSIEFAKEVESFWENGPDKLYPAKSYTSTKLHEAVLLRTGSKEDKLIPLKPQSIYTLFQKTVQRSPLRTALVWHDRGKDLLINFDEYFKLCHLVAKSFIALGLKPHGVVSIIGHNSPPWMISLFGIIFSCGVPCGIHSTNSIDVIEHILKDNESEIILVDSKAWVKKIIQIKDKIKIKNVILFGQNLEDDHNGFIISWANFMKLGEFESDESLQTRIKMLAPNRCVTLVYTNGACENPKGAMLSHDNINLCSTYAIQTLGLKCDYERFVSFLPLSNIKAQLFDCFLSVLIGATVYIARQDALTGTILNTLHQAKPTFFMALPKLWHFVQDKIIALIKSRTPQYGTYRSMLGLNECRNIYSCSAPLPASVAEFFKNINIKICDAYGLSETGGPHILGVATDNNVGAIGSVVNNFNKTKIVLPNPQGIGEICLFGRNIFMGFLNNDEMTAKAIDSDGWLHTGDLGRVDQMGYLYLNSRVKDIFIDFHGHVVPCLPIEAAIKAELPYLISNCVIYGENEEFPIVLITLQSKLNAITHEPLDVLKDDTCAWLKSRGCEARRIAQIIEDKEPFIYTSINKAIQNVNNRATNTSAIIQQFALLPKDFSIQTGELDASGKLKRKFVFEKYQDIIDSAYV